MEQQRNIENIPQIKKQAEKLGFGTDLNDGIDFAYNTGMEVYSPLAISAFDFGEAFFQPKITFGQRRAFFNGYEATLVEGLMLDQTIAGIDVRDLTMRMANGPGPMEEEEMSIVIDNYEIFFNNQVRQDLSQIRENNEDLFLAITSRFGTHGLELDENTLSRISTYGIEHTRSRWFPAEEKITTDEAARMLVKSANPAAVRKELTDYRSREDVAGEWQNRGYGDSRELLDKFNQLDQETFLNQKAHNEKEFSSYTQLMRRFSDFMKNELKNVGNPQFELTEKKMMWLYIDFSSETKSVWKNMHLERVPDEENYLANKYRDYKWTEGMTKDAYWSDVKALQQGHKLVIETGDKDIPLIHVSANPEFKTILIADASDGKALSHDQFRTDKALERGVGSSKRNEDHSVMHVYDGTHKTNKAKDQKKNPELNAATNAGQASEDNPEKTKATIKSERPKKKTDRPKKNSATRIPASNKKGRKIKR
ncbi:hypothetical protein ACQKLP_10875 [Chitinophaga sp. NPDC101104]|uniref:hypothetical protein n=1 Tax=Chitinophaga sp. NPDC101104 TaxID=3390561 RepID=UPI003CFF9F62